MSTPHSALPTCKSRRGETLELSPCPLGSEGKHKIAANYTLPK